MSDRARIRNTSLGTPQSELERLIKQAAFFGDLTAHTLKLAGLGPGMRVLDLGCGAGDVSLLAASIVGPSGSVTGVDMNADTVKARAVPHRRREDFEREDRSRRHHEAAVCG